MSGLNRADRRQLLHLLAAFPLLRTQEGRTRLLTDLPEALVSSIPRSSAITLDLNAILEACVAWGERTWADEKSPLLLLLENASDLTTGSKIDQELQAIRSRLFPPAPTASATRLPCPYPGLLAFTKDEAAFFFGRENEIR